MNDWILKLFVILDALPQHWVIWNAAMGNAKNILYCSFLIMIIKSKRNYMRKKLLTIMGWQSSVIFVCNVNIQNNKICSDGNNCPLITLDTKNCNLTSIVWIRIGMMTSLVFYKKTRMFLQADKRCVHRKSKLRDQVRSKWHGSSTCNACASNVLDTVNIFVTCYRGRAAAHSSERWQWQSHISSAAFIDHSSSESS